MRHLSQEEIFTFRGNVLPLRLLGGEEYGTEEILWSVDNASVVQITDYSKGYPFGGLFTDGVLLTFLEVGEATVTASCGGITYSCQIAVREMQHAESDDALQYFVGDMHDHTCNYHTLEEFSNRDASLYPYEHYMKQMAADGKMDFAVVSDHGDVLNARDFFRGYVDAGRMEEKLVFFPGAEGQVTQVETDRYGVPHMHGGEVLTFNADRAVMTDSWDGLFAALKNSPFAFCGYPHPQIIGFSVKGIWDFQHRNNNDSRFRKLFRFTEMGDGTSLHSHILNEYIYSVALDEGFHVSPTCASDYHTVWGYDTFPGKTVIMAKEKSKEAFLDAILNNRMYATSTGNVKLWYCVNGKTAPTTLKDEGVYTFRVKLDYFRPDEPNTHIQKCTVITDGGVAIAELDVIENCFEMTVTAPDAHYFYLCLCDKKGMKTWSCPVWTGKPFDKKPKKKLRPIDKQGMKAFDRVSGKEAPELINDVPEKPWLSENETAELVFDLGEAQEVSALSHYPLFIDRKTMVERGREYLVLGKYPSCYRISVSDDGENFREVKHGHFRVFGAEETVCFEPQRTRYVRLEILSTIGKEWGREKTKDATLMVAEISLWKEDSATTP